jgi:hypothetical protein
MTTSSTIERPTPWSSPQAQTVVDGYGAETHTLARAAGKSVELVFVESSGGDMFWLTREQAADFAEALHKVSGMATSTYEAQFAAEIVRDSLARKGLTQTRVCAATGITRHRLRRILSGSVSMTHDEHVAISKVTP